MKQEFQNTGETATPQCLHPHGSGLLLKPNPAPVPQHWIKSQRQSFGWSREEQLYCFTRQRGPQRANALTTVCPDLAGVVSFIVMVPRGRDQLADSLLIGWWGGKWESASSTFCSNQSGVYVPVGSIQLASPTWWGFQYLQNSSKICYVYPLRGNQDPAPRLFLVYSSLVSHPLFPN